MKSIRPFERADSARVASVYERVARSGSSTPAPGLAAYLERLLLDQPWSDPDLPSLVYELDGQIVAFLGIHVRCLQFDGRPIRLAAFGQLVSDPDVRGRPGGALLLRYALGGPQDISTAYFPTSLARMWESLGGRTRFMTSTGWVRILRPAGVIAEAALQRAHRPALERFVRPVLVRQWRSGPPFLRSAVDSLLRGTTSAASSSDDPVEPLTPAAVVEHLPSVAAGLRIRPDYDVGSLDWLLGELHAARAERSGRVWYGMHVATSAGGTSPCSMPGGSIA